VRHSPQSKVVVKLAFNYYVDAQSRFQGNETHTSRKVLHRLEISMIHLTFSSSGAGSLRQALKAMNHSTKVLDLCDDLSFGPIAPDDFSARQAWLNQNLPLDDQHLFEGEGWDWIATGAHDIQNQLVRHKEHLIWVAPQNIGELCGLHWYLNRWSSHNASFILVEDALPGGYAGKQPSGIGELRQDQFKWLLEKAVRTSWDEQRFPQARWSQLCQDATNLRIIQQGQVISKAPDYFDELLLARCPRKWEKLHRMIAEGMIALWEVGHHVGDAFVCWRLRELASQGKIIANREMKLDYLSTDDPVLVRRS
jgi:Protein of unknown function/Domain of unknown function (DUF1835)